MFKKVLHGRKETQRGLLQQSDADLNQSRH